MAALGLSTRPTPKIPSKPVTKTSIEKMLKNPYYAGVIRYILKNLSLAFDLLEDCGRTYRKANDNIKKLMCQAIFNRIWIHEDGTVTTEFTDIYKNIVGPIERDLINQNIKSASAETDADFIDKLLKSYSNFFGQGLNNELLVDPKGFEPSTSRMRTERSPS